MQLDKAIRERRSVMKFYDKKPKWQDIIEAIDAARHAPLAGNLHCVKFILVDDPDKIAKLIEHCQQDFFTNVDYVVVACSDSTGLTRSFDEKGEVYARQEAGAAIQNFLLKITDLGLATCWIEAFAEDQVRSVLKIPAKVNVEGIFPVGYARFKGKQKRKPNIDKYVSFNEYGNKYMKKRKNIEAA